MGSDAHDHDVIVVGGGPVGQVLAILLADRGWRVGLVERWAAPFPLPRACAIDHEVARILQSAGLRDAVETHCVPISVDAGHRVAYEAADGEVLLEPARPHRSASGWASFLTFFQPELEAAFGDRIAAHPRIGFLRGLEAVDVRDGDDAAEVVVAPHLGEAGVDPDAPRTTLRAAYVVGADGANSLVRERIGTASDDLGFAFDWLVVDFQEHEPRVWDPFHAQRLDPARPTTSVSVGRDRRRFEFMLLPGESPEEMNQEAVAWRLMEPWGIRPESTTLIRHAVYRFRGRWAEQWRRGRLLLAGDAAHLMPPFLGQGLCSGLRDAASLAWRLDLALGGITSDAVLDGYGPERREHVRSVVEQAVEVGRLICVTDPVEAAERDQRLRAAAQGTVTAPTNRGWALGPGLHRDGDPLAGRLGVQAHVEHDGRRVLLDDLLDGPRFGLVSPKGDPAEQLGPEATAAWRRLGGYTAHVGPGGDHADADGHYADWFAERDVELVLMRPDFYVYGSGALEDADVLVRSLAAALAVRVETARR